MAGFFVVFFIDSFIQSGSSTHRFLRIAATATQYCLVTGSIVLQLCAATLGISAKEATGVLIAEILNK